MCFYIIILNYCNIGYPKYKYGREKLKLIKFGHMPTLI